MNAPETRDFPIAVVISAMSGTLVHPSFGDVHECIEWMMGHPVWTHELAGVHVWVAVMEAVIEQHPALTSGFQPPTPQDGPLRGDAYLAFIRPWLAQMADKHGTDITLRKGTRERTEGPLAALGRIAPGKSVVVVVSDTEEGT